MCFYICVKDNTHNELITNRSITIHIGNQWFVKCITLNKMSVLLLYTVIDMQNSTRDKISANDGVGGREENLLSRKLTEQR